MSDKCTVWLTTRLINKKSDLSFCSDWNTSVNCWCNSPVVSTHLSHSLINLIINFWETPQQETQLELFKTGSHLTIHKLIQHERKQTAQVQHLFLPYVTLTSMWYHVRYTAAAVRRTQEEQTNTVAHYWNSPHKLKSDKSGNKVSCYQLFQSTRNPERVGDIIKCRPCDRIAQCT